MTLTAEELEYFRAQARAARPVPREVAAEVARILAGDTNIEKSGTRGAVERGAA